MGFSVTGLNKFVTGGWKESLFDVGDVLTPQLDMHGLRESAARLQFDILLGRTGASDRKTAKLLSVTDITFGEISVKYSDDSSRASNALTETLDTTTYPDKATLRLYNGRGFDVYLKSMTLQGKRIMQYSGEMGELIHDSLKRDDDIRRNGETTFEVGNEYIVTADQCARIADYWYKFLGKKKHIYSLQIPGTAPWYSVGDWYNLQVGEADTNEYIDAVVECYAVDCERVAGGIGSTTLLLRDVEDSWAKTTLYETRLATGGSPKRRVNRSNIVTVASSEYDGTYDWRCDGTDDDVQIQAAIDYISNTFGGGTVYLTSGVFNVSATITMKSNIVFAGSGKNSTVIKYASGTHDKYISIGSTIDNCALRDFSIDGNSGSTSHAVTSMYVIYDTNVTPPKNNTFTNIGISNVKNLKSETSTTLLLVGFTNCKNTYGCNVFNMTCENTATNYSASCFAFANVSRGFGTYVNCSSDSIYAVVVGNTANTSTAAHFDFADVMTNCYAGSAVCTNGNTKREVGYLQCIGIFGCISDNDSANSVGFSTCNSVQQCRSIGNITPYGSGATQSYSDAASTAGYECDDTPEGGFNS